MLRQWDYSRGGSLCRSAAVAQLQSVLPLLDAASTPAVGEQLLVSTADLGRLAAWASYDAGYHDDARRLFTLALSVAQQAEDPRTADGNGQPGSATPSQEALSLVQLGYGTAAARSQPLTASAASYLASYQAWGRAALGDARSCDRALGQSAEHFTHAGPNTDPPWAMYLTAAELAARHGHANYTLALTTSRAQARSRAVTGCAPSTSSYNPHHHPGGRRGTRPDQDRPGSGPRAPCPRAVCKRGVRILTVDAASPPGASPVTVSTVRLKPEKSQAWRYAGDGAGTLSGTTLRTDPTGDLGVGARTCNVWPEVVSDA